MHSRDARAAGESEQRVYSLPVWGETQLFTARERAALAFAEAVTFVAADHVPDEVYAEVAEHYSSDEIGALVGLLVTINAWNRIGVSTRAWTARS
jgi:alkylhydroperoxidase family enzyme